MTEIADLLEKGFVVLYGVLLGIGKWYFDGLNKKLAKNSDDIERLKMQLELNSQNDKAVERSIDELKETMALMQSTLNTFINNYSFVLDKMVDIEKKK